MARLTAPDEGSRLVYRAVGAALVPASGTSAVFYSDAAGTTLADIRDSNGNAVASTLTIDTYSRIPLFQMPDGVDTVYVSVAGGPVTPVYARTDDRLDTLAANVATNTTAISAEATSRAAGDAAEVTRSNGTYAPGTANDLSAFGVYFPELDGASPDGRQAVDGVTTAASATFMSATGAFTQADVGKAISLPGAGSAGALLFTTVQSVQSTTSLTLAVAASTSATAIVYRLGTDNGAALAACVARATATQNGLVRLRHGTYLTGQNVTLPNDKLVRIEGDGSDTTGTIVMRFGGTQSILSCNGVSPGSSHTKLRIRNVQFHGGDLAGNVLDLVGVGDSQLEGLLVHYAAGTLLRMSQWFNSMVTKCYFHTGGNGRTAPAVLMDSPGSAVVGGGGGNTVQFVSCEWEGNTGVDLRITSNDAGYVNGQDWTIAVLLTNIKMERNTGNYPLIDIDRGGAVKFSDGFFHLGSSATAAHVEIKGTAVVPTRPIGFSNCDFSSNTWNGSTATTGALVPYFIDLTSAGTVLHLSNVGMNGNPTTAYLHIGSTIGQADVRVSNLSVTDRSKLVLDDRANSDFGYGIIDLRAPTVATVAATTSVNRLVWVLPDGSTSTQTYPAIVLPADAVPGRPLKFRLLWYSDNNAGAIRWNVGYRVLSPSGDDITSGQSDLLVTATVPATANRTTTTTFTTASVAAPAGAHVAPYLARIGADAADTCTGSGRVLGFELLYERAL